MDIIKDEGGQIAPTERIEIILIGSVVLIVMYAMYLQIVNIGNIIDFVLGGFVGVITGAKLLNKNSNSTSTDNGTSEPVSEPVSTTEPTINTDPELQVEDSP